MRKGLSSSIKLDLITDHKSEQPQELPLLRLHQTHSTGQASTPEKQSRNGDKVKRNFYFLFDWYCCDVRI